MTDRPPKVTEVVCNTVLGMNCARKVMEKVGLVE